MKKYLIISVILCFSINIFAQQVTIDEAKQAASVAMYIFGKERSINNIERNISKVNTTTERGNTLMYEFVFNDNSSVLVSGNKQCEPILAYNETYKKSLFDEDVGCCLKAYIDNFKNNIDSCFMGCARNENDSNIMEWNYMLNAYNETSRGGGYPSGINVNDVNVKVKPLLKSRWGQSVPNNTPPNNNSPNGNGICIAAYNHYVEETGNSCADCTGNRCPTGCVATAMAQILYYHKYPMQFDWCNMKDSLVAIESVKNCRWENGFINPETGNWVQVWVCDTIIRPTYEKERNAIAYLMRQCGLDTGLKYCTGGKCATGGILTIGLGKVYRDYGYGDAYRRLIGIYSELEGKMRNNLDNGYPVHFSTYDHSFVCDGYGYQISNGNNLFHFNWGWNDDDDAFKNLWIKISNLDGESDAILDIYPTSNMNYCNYNVTYNNSVSHLFIKGYPTNITVNFNQPILNIINSGQEVEYSAHNSIIIKPGFRAAAGSNFRAHIEPCANCPQGSPSPAPQNPNVYLENEDEHSNNIPNLSSSISVFPNPTTGIVNIIAENTKIENISVFDISGKVLENNTSFAGNTLDLSRLSNGIYFIKIKTLSEQVTHKVIIQK